MNSRDWNLAVAQTDTVWGLIAKPSHENFERIYEIKKRDRNKPLILFVNEIETMKKYSNFWSEQIETLCKQYWPGALTVILEKSKALPDWLNPEFDSVGFRIPDSRSTQKLLANNEYLLSTSANFSGQEPAQNYQEAMEVFSNHVDLILEPEADEKLSGTASSIIKFSEAGTEVLRQGDAVISK